MPQQTTSKRPTLRPVPYLPERNPDLALLTPDWLPEPDRVAAEFLRAENPWRVLERDQ